MYEATPIHIYPICPNSLAGDVIEILDKTLSTALVLTLFAGIPLILITIPILSLIFLLTINSQIELKTLMENNSPD